MFIHRGGKLTAITLFYLRQINVENPRPLNSQRRQFLLLHSIKHGGKYPRKRKKCYKTRLRLNQHQVKYGEKESHAHWIGRYRTLEHHGRADSWRQRRAWSGGRRGDDLQPERPVADLYRRLPANTPDPRPYLLAGSLLFVSYEICLALSVGLAGSRQQAIEVGMVNYLWPSLTILFAILFNGQKSSWLVIPGYFSLYSASPGY
jgi:hypothetical protein